MISFTYWILFSLAYWIVPKKFKNSASFSNQKYPNLYKYIPIVFLIIIVAFSYSYNGLRINLDLSDVYEMRMQSRELGIPEFMNYIMPWAGNVVFPIIIIKMFIDKKYVKASVFIVAVLLLFSITGIKTWLFVLITSLIWVLFIKGKDFIFKLPVLLFLINVVTYFEVVILKSSFFINHFIRRVFFITSLTNYNYLDFFTDNPKLLLTDSALGWIKRFGFVGPYDNEPISRLIGRIYYNNINMNASSGTIADAYANFGWLGILIYPFLLMLLFRLMDKYSYGIESRILIPIIVSMSILLLNGNIFSVMTTYGYIFALLYIAIFPKKSYK
jgi:oligosaccharide repeat unit polymerase